MYNLATLKSGVTLPFIVRSLGFGVHFNGWDYMRTGCIRYMFEGDLPVDENKFPYDEFFEIEQVDSQDETTIAVAKITLAEFEKIVIHFNTHFHEFAESAQSFTTEGERYVK